MPNPQMNDEERKRIVRRCVQYTNEARKLTDQASAKVAMRTDLIGRLRAGGMSMQRIADAVGISRQNLEGQLKAYRGGE